MDMSGMVFKKYFQKNIYNSHDFSRTDSRSLGSDDTPGSPRTPDGELEKTNIFMAPEKYIFKNISGSTGILEFALIYDEINKLLLVNILRAKVLT